MCAQHATTGLNSFFFSLSKLPRYLAGIVFFWDRQMVLNTNPWHSHTTQPIRRSLAGSNVENSKSKVRLNRNEIKEILENIRLAHI